MSPKTKVLLLNPPGKNTYIRDYYCSKVSKAYYYPQPVDLLMQSAYFPSDSYELQVIDCIANDIEAHEALARIEAFSTTYIIGLMGSVSLEEDQSFYALIHDRLPEVQILASGDALLEDYPNLFNTYPWLQAIVTNFFLDGARRWIEGESNLTGIVTRENLLDAKAPRAGKLPMPVPRHDLFKGNYRMPFANSFPMATVLTNYACPYPCTFCIMSTLPYATRSAESIIAELKALKEWGYRYIYFSDQTFFQSKAVTREVLHWMVDNNYGINWMCFSRVDVLNEEDLQLMKKAGCNLIMFGVEWADEKYLTQYKKNYTLDQIRTTFALSKKLGIKRLGTFLIGVPGQSKESIVRTVQFAKELDADYASFNVAVPRSNTSFREEAIEANLIDADLRVMDQSGEEVTMGTGSLSREEIQELKVWAYRSFYFRPTYILKRIVGLRNPVELKTHFREAMHMAKRQLKAQDH